MMTAINKIIVRTAIDGLIGAVVVFCYGLGIFSMCFPGVMADFYDEVGNTKLSAMYYGRVYERTSTNENLYYALSKNILAHSDSAVIKYGNKWFALDPDIQTKLTSQVDVYLTKDLVDGSAEKTALEIFNTDFVLRRGYVVALINKGEKGKATDFLDNHCPKNQDLLYASLTIELGEV